MKEQIKTPILIVIAVVFVVAVGLWGYSTIGKAGNLDQGQIKYTPGTPPWLEKDPNKRGPGGPSGAGVVTSQTGGAPSQPGMPVGPPVISSQKK